MFRKMYKTNCAMLSYNVQHGEQLLFFFRPLPDFPGSLPPPEFGPSIKPSRVTTALLANNEIIQIIEVFRCLLKQ